MRDENDIIEYVTEMGEEEFAIAVNKLSPLGQLQAMKKRCDEINDERACKVYDRELYGDPVALAGTPRNLGLMGMWNENRDIRAWNLLTALGKI